MDSTLLHIGVKRRSGRYPFGSGKDPQAAGNFLRDNANLRALGYTEAQRAEKLGVSVKDLRSKVTWANAEEKRALMDRIKSKTEKGMTISEIAKEEQKSSKTISDLLKKEPKSIAKARQIEEVADKIESAAKETGYLDIGKGVERQIGVPRTQFDAAVSQLKSTGWNEHTIRIKNITSDNKYVSTQVLAKTTDTKEVYRNQTKIRNFDYQLVDGKMVKMGPPKEIPWEKIKINYKEDGGIDKDGVIELRRGAKDLDLEGSKYAQVRINVGGTHYLKGMAMYSDDVPKGKDIVFNTNKPKGTPKEDVLKELKKDKLTGKVSESNQFGATISRQNKSRALNIVNEEGDWDSWSKSLSSQFLAKQPINTAKERLNDTLKKVEDNYSEIQKITNPIVKRQLLEKYSEELESKQYHIKAAAPSRSKAHVLLPFPNMKPNEVYAPNFKHGENVILVRYPHGGTFEIPELKVNNRGPARKILGDALDAIGIHPSVAEKLSGADFDGDTVMVIPNNNKRYKSSPSLKELENFDPKQYKVDHPTITPEYKQKQMGIVSNLITDMTAKNAPTYEIAAAVRHSMVVIDSEKHHLDYKQSAKDNNIANLIKKYQGHKDRVNYKELGDIDPDHYPLGKEHAGGASTLMSRRKAMITTKGHYEEYTKNGKVVKRFVKDEEKHLLSEIKDAHDLKSTKEGLPIENVYANYINKLKVIKNKVDKDIEGTKNIKRDPRAAAIFQKEVKSINDKLNIAMKNAPKERAAKILANDLMVKRLKEMGGRSEITSDQYKRLKGQVMDDARYSLGIIERSKREVNLTKEEWDAIQAGAVSNETLLNVIRNGNLDTIRKLAMPRENTKLSPIEMSRAQAMINNGFTQSEVAHALGLSVTTINRLLKAGVKRTTTDRLAASSLLEEGGLLNAINIGQPIQSLDRL